MPAKIRKIKGKVKLKQIVKQIDPFSIETTTTGTAQDASPYYLKESAAVFEFNKSLNYKGGTLGKINISELSPDTVQIKVKQDLNDDGKFSKDELIYKGKIEGIDDAEALLNFEGKIKIKKQMHSCDWEIQKNPENLICTRDYVFEYTELNLFSPQIIKMYPIENSEGESQFPIYSNNWGWVNGQ